MIVVTVEQVITYSDPAILVVVPIVVIVFLVVFIVVFIVVVIIVAIVVVGKLIVASEQVPPSATVVVFTGEVLEVCLRAV